jgi:hypothetical protein
MGIPGRSLITMTEKAVKTAVKATSREESLKSLPL